MVNVTRKHIRQNKENYNTCRRYILGQLRRQLRKQSKKSHFSEKKVPTKQHKDSKRINEEGLSEGTAGRPSNRVPKLRGEGPPADDEIQAQKEQGDHPLRCSVSISTWGLCQTARALSSDLESAREGKKRQIYEGKGSKQKRRVIEVTSDYTRPP